MGGCSRNIDRIPIPFSLKWFPVKIASAAALSGDCSPGKHSSERGKSTNPFRLLLTFTERGWVGRVWFCPKEKKSER